MKTLNWKVAILIFTALAIIDAVLLPLTFLPPFHGTLLSVAWWIFNAPGFPIAMIFGQLVPQEPSALIFLLICSGVFSALVWSAVGGFIFRYKYVA